MRWLRLCLMHASMLRCAMDGQQRTLMSGVDSMLGTHVARRSREHYGTFLERMRIFRRWRRWTTAHRTASAGAREKLAGTMLRRSATLTARRRAALIGMHRGHADGHRHAEHGSRGIGPHGCFIRWAVAVAGSIAERARAEVCQSHLRLMRTARHFAAWRGVVLGCWCVNSRAYINVRPDPRTQPLH
jgi:hypothetical protein